MGFEGRGHVLINRMGDTVAIDVPRLFKVEGIIHAVVLTFGIILVGAFVQTQANLPKFLPHPLNAHATLLLWSVLLGGYALFVLSCLMGFGSKNLWRLGELGRRGSYVALVMYSVHIKVSPDTTEVAEHWFIRRRTRRIPTKQITAVAQNECGLTIAAGSGHTFTWWFSLYPPTVKRLKTEIGKALRKL